MHNSYFSDCIYVKRPLNSVALAIATHRKPEKMFNGTGTQVKAQMIDKYRMKMILSELYNGRDLPRRGDRKNGGRDTVAL